MNSPSTINGWRSDLEEHAHDYNLALSLSTMIGMRIMPEFVTDKAHARFAIANINQARRRHITKHKSGAGFTRITMSETSGTYDCMDFGLEIPVDKKRRSEYPNAINWEQEDAAILDFSLRLAHEIRVAYSLFDDTAFPPNNPEGAAWTIATRATMTPKADIDASFARMRGKISVPRRQLALILSYDRWLDLKACSEVKDQVKYVTTDLTLGAEKTRLQMLADYLEIKEIVVGQSQYVSSPQGVTTDTYEEVWAANRAMLTHLAPGPAAAKLYDCIGRTVRWSGINGDLPSFVTMDTYDLEETDTTVTRARQFTDEFVLAENGVGADLIDTSKSQ